METNYTPPPNISYSTARIEFRICLKKKECSVGDDNDDSSGLLFYLKPPGNVKGGGCSGDFDVKLFEFYTIHFNQPKNTFADKRREKIHTLAGESKKKYSVYKYIIRTIIVSRRDFQSA